EFEQGTPELTLARATPPFSEDASGLPLDVEGDSFLALTMRGGSRQTDAGTSSYDGPTDFDPAFPMLVDLVEGGDFERQSTWYLGLTDEACARVTLLDDPPRVVIDVER
ncbi:MAG: AMIN-like domain-containing (lipo)protein, partial [Candidatus Limnocylindria bacterium]